MIKKILKKYNTIPIIIIVSLFISQPLLWKNFDIYYDDGIQHIARAISTYTKFDKSNCSFKLNKWIWIQLEFILWSIIFNINYYL